MGASGSQDANARGVIMLGCVAYSESVCTIWEGMRQYFAAAGVSVDFVLFSSYDRQVEALVRGQIDVAWNGPLAHARIKKRTGGKSLSLGMRDCDRDFTSLLLVRKDVAGLKGLTDLAGKKVATGSYDSPQAYILPLQAVATAGGTALLAQMHVVRFDRDIGKHGDTAAGELEVMQALSKGEGVRYVIY
ncbi:ABC transporter [Pavlovales sp. CCMP2436]|nr:ABC transporter [Pavlovales sp. CCMP2436]